MKIIKLDQLLETENTQAKRMAVVAADDQHVLEAVIEAKNKKIVDPILIGDKTKILDASAAIGVNLGDIEIINEPSPHESANIAAKLAQKKEVDIIMKGKIATESLLKCILAKENSLIEKGLLSHVAVFESPYYRKLLGVTDAAMNISPDLNEKKSIIQNVSFVFHSLGIKNPKIAILAAVETVNPKMEATQHAALLTIMNKRGQITGCTVDGPLALDNAISAEAAKSKNIFSEVAGDADILVVPEINTGNVLYKAMNFLGGAHTAAIIVGAKIPVVLTSRADSKKSKLLSIALAAKMN